ncbi:MAG: VanZ family protein [Mahellales bacterium]|jgi:VanZ family protein
MPNKKLPAILFWVAAILWMVVIFYLSHQTSIESGALSTGLVQAIVGFIRKIFPQSHMDINRFNFIVRKGAHFLSYLVLGILVLGSLRRSGFRRTKAVALALVLCAAYAISDETHQLFVPGRAGQIRDVIIDSCGALAGIGVYGLLATFSKSPSRISPD